MEYHASPRWRAVAAALLLIVAGGAAMAADVVAKIGDTTITMDELDKRASTANMQAYQALYEARKSALDQLIAERLLATAAKDKGVSVEQLVQQEIESRIAPVSDAEVQSFYDQNKDRLRGRAFEEVSGQIHDFLASQRRQEAQQAFYTELRGKQSVTVSLQPPRADVPVSDSMPSKGPADAPVQIVEFSEFQCPYCGRVEPTVQQILSTYGDKVRLVFADFPLPMHNNAQGAAEAAQCAAAQGKFWEYHDVLFANQRALEVDKLKSYAADLGLDTDAFNTCVDQATYRSQVQSHQAIGRELGVTGTPAFFINGRFLNGAQPLDAFSSIIDDELAMAGVSTSAASAGEKSGS